MHSSYLLDLTILLAAGVVLVFICQLLRLGAVIGFLLAGIVVGPSGFDLIGNISSLSRFSELGIALLLFFLGIELKPARLWAIRRQILGLGSLQLCTSSVAIFLALYWLLDLSLELTLFLALALAFSSTAFVVQLLHEKKLLVSEFGRAAFAILLLQDLAVVPLLALIPALANPESSSLGSALALTFMKAAAIVSVAIVVGRFLIQPMLRKIAGLASPELFTTAALFFVLGLTVITEYSGLSIVMGAFLAGLLLADSPYRHQIMAEINPFRSILLGLFFMTMGMELNLQQLQENTLQVVVATLLLIAIKTLALWPVARYFLPNKRMAPALALTLAQSGEFSLVLFALAFKNQLLAAGLYQQLLVVALLSMFATPLLVSFAARLVKQHSSKHKVAKLATQPVSEQPVVIVGFGRVGQHVAAILEAAQVPYIATDKNPENVHSQRQRGREVYYGDSSPEVLRSIGAAQAQVIIVTMDDIERTASLVHALCTSYPKTKVIARAHDLQQCQRLRNSGATLAVAENLEASLKLAQAALQQTEHAGDKERSIIDAYRERHLKEA